MIEPFKYLLQPVALERDDQTGRVVRELPGQTLSVYDAEQAAAAIIEFEAQLRRLAEPTTEEATADAGRADRDPEHHL